jgi:hypothetical protein
MSIVEFCGDSALAKMEILFASAENSTACCRDEAVDEPRRSFSEGGSRLRRNSAGKLGSLLPRASFWCVDWTEIWKGSSEIEGERFCVGGVGYC